MNPQAIKTYLQGKKTYVLLVIGAAYMLGVWLGFYEFDEKIAGLFGLGFIGTIRAAIGKSGAALILAGALLAGPAQGATNELPSNALENGFQYVSAWFKDNTNFWGERTAMVNLMPVYSKGRVNGATEPEADAWGAAISLQFPLDENGQVSVGFFGAYFNHDFFAGSVNLTLGKTVEIPVIKQPAFLWVEGGPAINLNAPDALLAQTFTGAVWRRELGKDWSLFLSGGVGQITGWDGPIYIAGLGIGKKL